MDLLKRRGGAAWSGSPPQRRPRPCHLLTLAVLVQGLSGLVGGAALVKDPSGRSIGLPLDWLVGTSFSNYFIPGLILLVVLGIFPLVVALGLRRGHRTAGLGAFLVGLGLTTWILVEILMIGYQPHPPLQAIYGFLGLAILGLAVRCSVGPDL